MNASAQQLWIETPLGRMLLAARNDRLWGAWFEGQRYWPEADANAGTVATPFLRDVARQILDYFAGARDRFDVLLSERGTGFQRSVWREIASVPYGATISYATLANACARPSATRAAGAATGRNPWTLIVPCHRIVGSHGELTGYAGGLQRKQALLELERRVAAPAKAA